jgi:DNA-binding NtrC family response regulator
MAGVFIQEFSNQMDMPEVPQLTEGALKWMKNYWWPGNVRELRNVIERAVLLSSGGRITEEQVAMDKMVSSVICMPSDKGMPEETGEGGASGQEAEWAASTSEKRTTDPALSGLSYKPPPTSIRGQPMQDGDGSNSTVNLRDEMQQFEYRRIMDALERAGGNQTKAAQLLGISRRTLINRLDAYGIERPRKRPSGKKS